MDYVIVGKVGKPFGVKGLMKVHSFTEPADQVADYQPWLFKNTKTDWHSLDIENIEWRGEQLMLKLAKVDTPEQAKLYTNWLVGVERTHLPAPADNEYYWSDLEGLKVITTEGVELGKVAYLMATGANDVIIVKGEKERVLPYLPEQVIKNIDLAKGEMLVDWDPEF